MDILTLTIVGAMASAIVSFIKTKYSTSGWQSVLSLVVVSLVGGFGFWLIGNFGFLEISKDILISANLIYTLFLKQISK